MGGDVGSVDRADAPRTELQKLIMPVLSIILRITAE
jgi:hypothetical protein